MSGDSFDHDWYADDGAQEHAVVREPPADDAVLTEESAPDAHGVITVYHPRRSCLRCGGPPHGYAGCPEHNPNLD